MHTDKVTVATDTKYGEDSEATLSPEEFRAHVKRVEDLCNLVESLFGALAQNPMFRAMIPPDLLAKFTS